LTDEPIVSLGLILLTACLVAILTRRIHLPYSIGLVAAGAGLGFLPPGLDIPLSRDLVFTVFLPPLIFEAALHLDWPAFRKELPATLLLAFPGVVIAAGTVALGVHLLLDWSWIGASLFGALIAATDPVSVIAAFKEMKVEPRLSLVVESESLLNDGAAAVGFGVLTTIAAGGSNSVVSIAGSLIWTIAGGVAVGGAVAGLLLLFAGRTVDHLVEITLTTIAAYGSFLLAEHFGMSGVLGSLTAGLVVGNVGWKGAISESSRDHVIGFWEYAAFLANSVIFILIGGHEAHQPIAIVSGAAVVAIVLVLIGRALAVYPLSLALIATPLRLSLRHQHVLFWGGLRGALALALALALPQNIPERREIIVVSFAVVAFSIFVQGLTMPWLIRALGFRTG
jgi:CPA1 family monovalent cation:H+ antiporter